MPWPRQVSGRAAAGAGRRVVGEGWMCLDMGICADMDMATWWHFLPCVAMFVELTVGPFE